VEGQKDNVTISLSFIIDNLYRYGHRVWRV